MSTNTQHVDAERKLTGGQYWFGVNIDPFVCIIFNQKKAAGLFSKRVKLSAIFIAITYLLVDVLPASTIRLAGYSPLVNRSIS